MGVLNRMVLLELIKFFILALIGLTSILVLAVVVVEAQQQGLDLLQVMAIIPLVIPSTMPYTIPTTTLFATCIVYGRLAHDNEILAIKAAGVNLLHVIRPALFMGIVTSLITAVLFWHVIPTTYHMMKTMALEDLEGVLYSFLRRQGRFSHEKLDWEIYVKRVEGRTLHDALFMRRDSGGSHYDVIGKVREAELRVDKAHQKVHILMKYCQVISPDGKGTMMVENEIWTVDFPANLGQDRKARRSDMTWNELENFIEETREKVENIKQEISLTTAMINMRKGPANLTEHLKNLKNIRKEQEKTINYFRGEKHRRLAVAMGCFCFVLVGCPVGIWFSRSDYLSAFVICFLPIVMIYYPLIICGDNLVKTTTLDPLFALWPANLLMILISLVLYRKLLRH